MPFSNNRWSEEIRQVSLSQQKWRPYRRAAKTDTRLRDLRDTGDVEQQDR